MTSDTDIAVVGVGCRFPDAWTPQEYWRNIDKGVVSTRELSDEQLRSAGVSEELLRSPDFVRVAATLPAPADFAAEFFGFPPTEAELIDPQQRIFLEACWEALEWAGHPAYPDGPVVGVFAGSAVSTYSAALFAAKTQASGLVAALDDLDLTLGGLGDFLTSRVGYKLGLRGPTVAVQTACSSSLYAVHYAALSLLSGECDIALAGGATVLEPRTGYRSQPGGLTSQDGYCRAFDARSSGTSFSSGVGVVALRRLSDALADGDHVLAVLRGSAVGNDGATRSGFTAPTPAGVADVAAAALRVADVPAEQLCYLEAHGSGTALGDHIELLGLTAGLQASASRTAFCGLGSVKVNIGHSGPAAGIAGFIKAVHIAATGALPPHPLLERPRDPGLLAESPFFLSAVPGRCPDLDRHVLVNSMGVGGTNVAAVLGAPPTPVRAPARPREVVRLVLSARTRIELDALSRRLADELVSSERNGTGRNLDDVAHTLRVGRHGFAERRMVTAPRHQLAQALRLPRPPASRTVRATPRDASVVLPAGAEVPTVLLDGLLAALPAQTEVLQGPSGQAATSRFQILIGHGEPGPDQHVMPITSARDTDQLAERIDDAITAAWLHGVAVSWEALSGQRGRRVPLPTYPFQRHRYWALDRLAPIATPVGPADHPEITAPAPRVATAGSAGSTGSLENELLAIWRDLFGIDTVSVTDEFGALGGTSLLSVRMALEAQQRFGVLVNLHRAGGSKATVGRIAEIIRGRLGGAGQGDSDVDPVADDDGALIDADLQLPLGPLACTAAPGSDVLLTGATGFLGAFLLAELLNTTEGRIYCLVRAPDEAAGWKRLVTAAAKFELPEPDRRRVHVVPGNLTDIADVCQRYRAGELAQRVGYVLHCAAKVVFTEPYRVLRQDNTLPLLDLLRWMRSHGIRDIGFVSTVAATHYALGTQGVLGVQEALGTQGALGSSGKIRETREQPLDPQQGGYGVGKWVAERLLERAEHDGMQVRVFRPGYLLGATETGACNDKDLLWSVLASGLAVGAHPCDDRGMPMAPVDVVARAIAELTCAPGSVGRVYHLTDEIAVSPRRLFGLLHEMGWVTEAVSVQSWQQLVADRALLTGNELLSTMALYEVEGHQLGERDLEAVAWRPWLQRHGLNVTPTGALLHRCLTFLAQRYPRFADLLIDAAEPQVRESTVLHHNRVEVG